MPKGSGASRAFAADEQTLESNSQFRNAGRFEATAANKKVTIAIPEDVLYAADLRVLQLRKAGRATNRSDYIAALIREDTNSSL